MTADDYQEFTSAMTEFTITIRDYFTPAIKQVGRAFRDFAFEMWLSEQPRYLRPLMRFAYRVETLVLYR